MLDRGKTACITTIAGVAGAIRIYTDADIAQKNSKHAARTPKTAAQVTIVTWWITRA